ncbi:hypothetical protein [Lentzea sp.]|uniref:hypothetical protein n=1 Tax=Lentzea sp. TaxID=56099 RepID=UPI002ED2C011
MITRIIRVVLAGLLLGALSIAAATPAGAAGTAKCASTSNLGRICVTPQGSNGHYNAEYWNQTQNSRYVDFNLLARGIGRFGDSGAFTVVAGGYRSYVFAIGRPDACVRLELYDMTGVYGPVITAYTC